MTHIETVEDLRGMLDTEILAEIQRLQQERDCLWGTLVNAYDDLKTSGSTIDEKLHGRRLVMQDIKRVIGDRD